MKQDVITQGISAGNDADAVIDDAMEAVRDHLDMEISYLAELRGETVHFRRVADPSRLDLIDTTMTRPLSDLYCGHMMAGELPRLMPVVHDIDLARNLPVTRDLGIKAHVSVPIFRTSGDFFGTFCCLSRAPNPTLNDRDLKVASMFANLTAKSLNTLLDQRAATDELKKTIQTTVDQRDFTIHWQPIVDLATQERRGFEALSRFHDAAHRGPNVWFAEAASVGLQPELEIAAISAAMEDATLLPADCYLSLNASAETIASGRLLPVLSQVSDPKRIVLEITEHEEIAATADLMRSIADLRELGVSLAIDDVGAGYAGLTTVLRLRPSILKLDRSLVMDIDQDTARKSLAQAMVHFAAETGAKLIAEGIERPEEQQTLIGLGVPLGQGYLFGKPAPVTEPVQAAQH